MLGPTLDVAIGLVLTFLLFALLLTSVMEAWAGLLKVRAGYLQEALIRMIEDPAAAPKLQAGVMRLFGRSAVAPRKADEAAETEDHDPAAAELVEAPTESLMGGFAPFSRLNFDDIYRHPLIGGSKDLHRPSYVNPERFSTALLQVLRGGANGALFSDVEQAVVNLPPGRMKDALTSAILEAQGDWTRLKAGVEAWFDTAMDRLSGDYKRFTQGFTFVVGFMAAAVCNVDAVQMVERLYAEPALRSAMVAEATRLVDEAKAEPAAPAENGAAAAAAAKDAGAAAPADEAAPAAKGADQAPSSKPDEATEAPQPAAASDPDLAAKQAAVEKARDLLLTTAPVGWSSEELAALGLGEKRPGDDTKRTAAPVASGGGPGEAKAPAVTPTSRNPAVIILGHVPGWIISALAGMLGAPFWFDLLQKLVNIRNAGPRPERSTPAAAT